MGAKQIRPSQFITTYGPGSLLPLSGGHAVTPSLSRMVNNLKKFPNFNKANDHGLAGLDKFEIRDHKMVQILLNRFRDKDIQLKLFRIPTNADLLVEDVSPIYLADPFPRWSVCYAHSDTPILARIEQDRSGPIIRCPFCDRERRNPGRGTPVRFIQACQHGHMDDMEWANEVHQGTPCRGNVFLWQETGSSSNFIVSCYGFYENNEFHRSACGTSVNYFTLKKRSENDLITCKGAMQEVGPQETSCDRPAKILLKNASNLRVAEILSSVYIPRYPGQLYLSLYPFRQGIDRFYKTNFMKDEFVKFLRERRSRWKIPLDTIKDVEDSSLQDLMDVINSLITEMEEDVRDGEDRGIDYETAHIRELESLLKTSVEGYPPQKGGEPTGLHIEPTDNFVFYSHDFDLFFKITPIRELFVTRVQLGYSREVARIDSENLQVLMQRTGDLIKTYYDEGDVGSVTRWFAGNQLVGEGLFIQVCNDDGSKNEDPLKKKSPDPYQSWQKLFESYPPENLEARRKTNPRFIWWHSLSHKIINELAIDSGFSANSIGERIYCKLNESKGAFESGILLYTAQTGGDGTLGGLTGLTRQFEQIMRNVAQEIRVCSNDPICLERKRTAFRLNGAACHACMLISETSCELQNKFLDRSLLIGTLKNGT